MDINRRKTGLGRLIEIAGTKRWLLIGAMSLAVITAIVQFVPIIAVYNILIELAKHALDPSLIDKAYIWQWGYIALGAFFAFGTLPLSIFCTKYGCSWHKRWYTCLWDSLIVGLPEN